MRLTRAACLLPIMMLLASCSETGKNADRTSLAPVHAYGAGVGGGSLGMYTVRRDETVWTIAQRYNLDLRDILDVNRMSPPFRLAPGQRLSLPAPRTYKVRAGDSLYAVSRIFNTSMTDLAKLNNLRAPYKLSGGQTLRLPARYETGRLSFDSSSPSIKRQENSVSAPSGKVERETLPSTNTAGRKDAPRYTPPLSDPQEYHDDVVTTADKGKAIPENTAPKNEISVPAETRVVAAAPARAGKFLKPVPGKVISGYGLKKDGLHNDGVNIQSTKGDPVQAAENGVIVYTGNQISGYGNLILIRHADQYVTAYAHLDKTLVKKGDRVKRGQTIGTVGMTGSVDKPQLHFEIRKGTRALNPSGLIGL